MELEYQLSNGSWVSVGARAEYFIGRCVGRRFGSAVITDAADAAEKLAAGEELSTGSDWYASLRCQPAPRTEPAPDPRPNLTCRSCGQTGHRGGYPFSTNPSSGRCDDCF